MKLKISKNLRELRQEKGWTQEQVAEKLGVSYQAVSRWETDATYPDIEILPVLADLFDVSLEKLMGVTKTEREEASEKYYQKLNATLDHEERLKCEKGTVIRSFLFQDGLSDCSIFVKFVFQGFFC